MITNFLYKKITIKILVIDLIFILASAVVAVFLNWDPKEIIALTLLTAFIVIKPKNLLVAQLSVISLLAIAILIFIEQLSKAETMAILTLFLLLFVIIMTILDLKGKVDDKI